MVRNNSIMYEKERSTCIRNQDVNVHCNENKTLSMSGKRVFCWFFIFLRFVVCTSYVSFVVVCHSRKNIITIQLNEEDHIRSRQI
ncbi:hypothetical protein ALC60_06137 [Trachymyrmex zeteki]|uniref:Uncharacterized protein n=1 Tax=Mycetomoellerius zeteki TaxID=64791 RepID=A0A151X3F7_9HYME|nr:hypothetical protein ALC60_06137 [Trachymyrmex zeteki]